VSPFLRGLNNKVSDKQLMRNKILELLSKAHFEDHQRAQKNIKEFY
jgi:hypothetical protein